MRDIDFLQKIRTTPIEQTIISLTNALYQPGVMDLVSKEALRDALSSGQLCSKIWLRDHFVYALQMVPYDQMAKVAVVGGWMGLLAKLLNQSFSRVDADSIDIDPNAYMIARRVVGFEKAFVGDMYEMDYTPYNVVVNTSAEHIPDLAGWMNKIPEGTVVVVQSNDAPYVEGHINCVDSEQELADKLGLKNIDYMGSLTFPMYTRFMVIGKK